METARIFIGVVALPIGFFTWLYIVALRASRRPPWWSRGDVSSSVRGHAYSLPRQQAFHHVELGPALNLWCRLFVNSIKDLRR